MSENEQQQSSDFSTAGDRASEEEIRSMKEEEQSPELAKQQKSGKRRGKRRSTTAIGAAAPGRQMTLFDLDKQLDRQRRLMESMADDIKHLRKQFNQVQRDLAKFQKRMDKMRTTASPSTKKGKQRG